MSKRPAKAARTGGAGATAVGPVAGEAASDEAPPPTPGGWTPFTWRDKPVGCCLDSACSGRHSPCISPNDPLRNPLLCRSPCHSQDEGFGRRPMATGYPSVDNETAVLARGVCVGAVSRQGVSVPTCGSVVTHCTVTPTVRSARLAQVLIRQCVCV